MTGLIAARDDCRHEQHHRLSVKHGELGVLGCSTPGPGFEQDVVFARPLGTRCGMVERGWSFQHTAITVRVVPIREIERRATALVIEWMWVRRFVFVIVLRLGESCSATSSC